MNITRDEFNSLMLEAYSDLDHDLTLRFPSFSADDEEIYVFEPKDWIRATGGFIDPHLPDGLEFFGRVFLARSALSSIEDAGRQQERLGQAVSLLLDLCVRYSLCCGGSEICHNQGDVGLDLPGRLRAIGADASDVSLAILCTKLVSNGVIEVVIDLACKRCGTAEPLGSDPIVESSEVESFDESFARLDTAFYPVHEEDEDSSKWCQWDGPRQFSRTD